MTQAQWLSLKVGDVIVDKLCGHAERTVLHVSHWPPKRGRLRTSVVIHVTNLKSRKEPTILFDICDSGLLSRKGGGSRFDLKDAA